MNNKIKFSNGSKILFATSSKNVCSKRSRLISFYCKQCKVWHVDYPVKDVIWIEHEGCDDMMCSEIIKEFLK